ncbi:MAG: hypothetical protein AB7N76_18190 [Planctomycetota bacterium]
MLERLDEIDWATLKHARGAATDVPDRLRALRSPDPAAREAALRELRETVVSQGARYSAAPWVIPALYELIFARDTPGRAALLSFLVDLGVGEADGFLPIGYAPLEMSELFAQAQASMTPEQRALCDELGVGPVTDQVCYDTVIVSLLDTIALLEDPEPAVRQAVAYLLAWFPGEGCSSVPPLQARLAAEQDPALVANLVLALGLLALQSVHEVDAGPIRARLRDERLVVRAAAAIALALSEPEDAVLDVLIEACEAPEELLACGLPWNSGDLAGYASLVLAATGGHRLERVVPALCAALERAAPAGVLDLTQSLLHLVQPEEGYEGVPGTDLSPLARDTLRAIARHPAWETQGEDLSGMLGSYGLPKTQGELRVYVD